MRYILALTAVAIMLASSTPTYAVGSCGGVSDNCQCNANNPYPCCNNGNGKSSNCTWGAWHMACCGFAKGLPGWSHAKYWAGNANSHPDYEVHGSAKVNSIACRDQGTWGHVAWVTKVNGGSITVHEQSCCEGAPCWPNCSYCLNGFKDSGYQANYYTGGFITKKGGGGPYCGDGSCNNGENCNSCSKDCGNCCGNGKCDNGENCSSCKKDCGKCCGNGKCDNGENCGSCSKDCGDCCGNGKCDNGENCSSCSKDCGNCCPNGKCDFGEDCASCEPDCGICNDPPEGEIEVFNCREMSGWALDPDVDYAISIRIKKDGNKIHEVTANGPHGKHDGHGFHLDLGDGWKDGQPHSLEIIGMDDKNLDNKAIKGSGKQVLCRTGSETRGIWTLDFVEAAGLDIVPASGEGGWTDLQLHHPGGLPYPVAGTLTASAEISLNPFIQVTGDLCGSLLPTLYQANVNVAGESIAQLYGEGPCTPFSWEADGSDVLVSFAALEMANDGADRLCSMRDLSFGARGWRFGYSGDASGLIWGTESVDQLTFAARSGAETCVGYAAAHRKFANAFEGIVFKSEKPSDGEPVVSVRVGDSDPVPLSECLVAGTCSITGLEADSIEVRANCGAGKQLNSGWQRVLAGIRIFREFEETMTPWKVVGERVWGLAAEQPFTTEAGLAFRISTAASDFVPYGAVTATTTWPAPPIEEVRGMLHYSLPGDCYQGFLTIDDVPTETVTFGEYYGPFTATRAGTTFGLAMTAQHGCSIDQSDGLFEVSNVSVKRGGWWTTPTPFFAGIKDGRAESGCGLLFENQKWWGMTDQTAQGSILVHRYLDGDYQGIRYRWRHTFEGPFYRLGMLLDNKPVKDYSLQKPGEWTDEVTGKNFSEVGFVFLVSTKDVYPYKWQLFVEDIELYRTGEGWFSACDVLEADPELEGIEEVTGGDVVSLPDGDGSGGTRSSGCGASHPRGRSQIVLLLAALLALTLLRTRRKV